MTTLYLLRNAQTLPMPDAANAMWALSQAGREQAQALVAPLQELQIDSIVSSPLVRAKNTVEPFSGAVGLQIHEHESLTDQILTAEYLPPSDFQELTQKMWEDFDFSEPGCESNRACEARVLKGIQQIVDEQGEKRVLVCTHGQIIALLLHALDESYNMQDWANMQMPHLYEVTYTAGEGRWERHFATPALNV